MERPRVEQAALCCLIRGNLHPCISKLLAPVSVLREAAVSAKQLMRGSLPRGMQGMEDTGSQGRQKHKTQNNHLELLMSVSGLAGFTLTRALGHEGCL